MLRMICTSVTHQGKIGRSLPAEARTAKAIAAIIILIVCVFVILAAGCTSAWWYPKEAKPISIDGKELVIMSTTVGEFVARDFEVIRTERVQSFVGYQSARNEEGNLSPSFGSFVNPESYEIDPSVDEVVEETPGSGDAVYMLIKDGQYYGIFSISLDRKAPLSQATIASYAFEPLDNIPVEQWPEIIWEGYDIRDVTPSIVEEFTLSPFSLPPEDYSVQPHGPTPSNPRGESNGLQLGDLYWTDISFSRNDPDLIRIFEIYMR